MFSGTAYATDFAELQAIKPLEIKQLALPRVTAPSPIKTAGNFRVTDNAALLAEFSGSFDYLVNGHPYFRYSMNSLRFYRLTGWPRRLLVQIQDSTLPDFHNFTVLDLSPESATVFSPVYRYNSQTVQEKYDAATLPDKVCALDSGCDRSNKLKKAEEAKARAAISSWDAYYFEALKPALLKKVEAHYTSAKFAKLGPAETAAASARFAQMLQKTAPGSGGKAALQAANEAEWKTELCGTSSVELMDWLRGKTPEEQDKIVLRCGFAMDADWIIKKEYENLAVDQLNGACLKSAGSSSDAAYCSVYNSWLKIYTLKTGMEELRLSGGRLGL